MTGMIQLVKNGFLILRNNFEINYILDTTGLYAEDESPLVI